MLPGNTIKRHSDAISKATLRCNCCRYLLIAGSTYPDFVTELPICTDWKGDSYDPILVIVNRLIRWKDLSMDFVTGLPKCTDWKGTSYNSIPADENGRLQAAADNDRCTRACGGHYRCYSSTLRRDVCWSFKANLSMFDHRCFEKVLCPLASR